MPKMGGGVGGALAGTPGSATDPIPNLLLHVGSTWATIYGMVYDLSNVEHHEMHLQ